ncbi:MAG: DUF3048 domain-containing protein [Patescibacteria group bacterium]
MINKKVVIFVSIFLFCVSVLASYTFFSNAGNITKSVSQKDQQPTVDPELLEPKTEECPINGKMMTKKQKDSWSVRRPLGIAIENSTDARPQSGLSSADVVYEAVAEGGITRFLAVYYCQDAPIVGPVRSARVHFITLLNEYGEYPLYAHVGGANCNKETGSGCANGAKADALGLIRKLGWEGYNDLNQFGVPFPYFWRDYERLPNRSTEHTVYTSTKKLWEYAKNKRDLTNVDEDGVSWDENFTSWNFQDDAKPEDRGIAAKIELGFWNAFSNDMAVVWNYDPKTNVYKRTNGGIAHVDKNTEKQLEVKNVIVVFAKESPANDGYDGGHILYQLTGTGDALVFRNGKATEASWTKKDGEARMKFFDENDEEIEIVRGQVFIEILPTGNKVNY